MSGLPTRIFSRRSCCNPFMTPMITIKALTPTSTPPMAMMLISDSSFEPRRLRKYLQAICSSSLLIPVSSSEKESHHGCSSYRSDTLATDPHLCRSHPWGAFRIPSRADNPRQLQSPPGLRRPATLPELRIAAADRWDHLAH